MFWSIGKLFCSVKNGLAFYPVLMLPPRTDGSSLLSSRTVAENTSARAGSSRRPVEPDLVGEDGQRDDDEPEPPLDVAKTGRVDVAGQDGRKQRIDWPG